MGQEKEAADMAPILNAPIIMDVGKTSRKKIRQLSRGGGKLSADVQDAVNEVTESLGDQAEGKQFVPVILLYQKKRRKSRRSRNGGGIFPAFF
jgi:hypothetical protein